MLDWRQELAEAKEGHLYRHATSTRYFARATEGLSALWSTLHDECW